MTTEALRRTDVRLLHVIRQKVQRYSRVEQNAMTATDAVLVSNDRHVLDMSLANIAGDDGILGHRDLLFLDVQELTRSHRHVASLIRFEVAHRNCDEQRSIQ